jgi:hypothetical protein
LSRIQAQLPYTALAARPTTQLPIQSLTLLLILVTMIMTIAENDTHQLLLFTGVFGVVPLGWLKREQRHGT